MLPQHDGPDISKLEAGFATIEVARRPLSLEMKGADRHANEADIVENDLDIDYDVDTETLPRNLYPSIQSFLPNLQFCSHMENGDNFGSTTKIHCFDQQSQSVDFREFDSAGLNDVLSTIRRRDAVPDIGDTQQKDDDEGRLLVFFVPLTPMKNTSFGSQVAMERNDVRRLFDTLDASPEFLQNFLGRPDYWAPRKRWQCNMKNELEVCDLFWQFPRWNVQIQGAPLSVYMIRQVKTKLTAYIISHKGDDTSVNALWDVLKAGHKSFGMKSNPSMYLTNPFEIGVLLATLSFEASKFHLARFRRYMWQQINKVDDHLAGLETSDRAKLTELTNSLHIIGKRADSHLLNANVALYTARGIRDAQASLHDFLGTPSLFRQAGEDAIRYVIESLEKQRMLFVNYKDRKEGTMSLVYNLVTQDDAANNIQLAQSMKTDSTSMNAIAALTMLFLPGAFTSSMLSAGMFSKVATGGGGFEVHVTGLWWFWVILTVPLTLFVVGIWWLYRHFYARKRP